VFRKEGATFIVRICGMNSIKADAVEGGKLISKLVPRARTQPVRADNLEVSHRLGAAMMLFPPQHIMLPFRASSLAPMEYRKSGRVRW